VRHRHDRHFTFKPGINRQLRRHKDAEVRHQHARRFTFKPGIDRQLRLHKDTEVRTGTTGASRSSPASIQ